MRASMLSIVSGGLAAEEDVNSADLRAQRVKAELSRVLKSVNFDASERNRRFLSYVVEETLMGRGDRIKAYTIATMVFGRDDAFDPTLDPVVRMEARRLRRSLERFYLVEGEDGPIRISLPKGCYVPQFPPAGTLGFDGDAERADEHPLTCRNPSIYVSSFELEYSHRRDINFCDGLARQIVVALSHVHELTVFMPCPRTGGTEASPKTETGLPSVDYFLAGNVVACEQALKVKTTLLDARSGRVIEAEAFTGDILNNDFLEERDRIADEIARRLFECITAGRQIHGR
ncbi:MAG: hypothetical protein KF810_23670 [Rhizobiaceae bacterium]|nr:hypothetical protein [Rhizobiaceae bacterium]